MKKLLISAGALAVVTFSTPAFAAATNSATANATVNIVSPLTLTNNTGLDFGTVVGPFAGETVRIDTAGNRNCGGLTCSGTTVSAANFTVSNGTANQNLAVTVDPSVSLTSGGNSLTVDLTTDLPTASSPTRAAARPSASAARCRSRRALPMASTAAVQRPGRLPVSRFGSPRLRRGAQRWGRRQCRRPLFCPLDRRRSWLTENKPFWTKRSALRPSRKRENHDQAQLDPC